MRIYQLARKLTLFLACTVGVTPLVAAASAYPARPVTIVVPFGPGSVTDLLARIVASGLADSLGQPFIVQNKPGAGGNIGAADVAHAKPDGYTLLVGATSTNAVNPSLYKNLRFDPLRDFAPISNLANVANVLVVPSELGVDSVEEFITRATENELFYGSTGTGGSMHLSGELFAMMTDTQLVHVPYVGGGAVLADLVPARIDAVFCNIPLCLSHIQSGNLTALAVTSGEPSELLPDVPTMSEAGVKDYDVNGWFGLFAPSETDSEIIETINSEVVRILEIPQIRAQLVALGAVPAGAPVAEFTTFVQQEHDMWAEVIERAGITVE